MVALQHYIISGHDRLNRFSINKNHRIHLKVDSCPIPAVVEQDLDMALAITSAVHAKFFAGGGADFGFAFWKENLTCHMSHLTSATEEDACDFF